MGIMKHIWDKKQDGNRKEERSFARVAIIASCIALLFLCLKRDNIFQEFHPLPRQIAPTVQKPTMELLYHNFLYGVKFIQPDE